MKLRSATLQFLSEHWTRFQLQSVDDLAHDVCLFLFVRGFRCFDAVTFLACAGYAFEALSLVRSELEASLDMVFIGRSEDREDVALDWVAYGETERLKFEGSSLDIGSGWEGLISDQNQLQRRAKRWKTERVPARSELRRQLKLDAPALGGFLSGWIHTASFALSSYGEIDSDGRMHFKVGPSPLYLAPAHCVSGLFLRSMLTALWIIWKFRVDEIESWQRRFDEITTAFWNKDFEPDPASASDPAHFDDLLNAWLLGRCPICSNDQTLDRGNMTIMDRFLQSVSAQNHSYDPGNHCGPPHNN